MKQIFIYVFVFLFVVSCGGGGGGGGGGSTPPPNPAPSVNLSASSFEQLVNSNVTLTWSSSNATSCSASGDWSDTKSTSGFEDVTIRKAGSNTYSLACSGAGGTRSDAVIVVGYRNTDGIVVDGYISGADVFIDENDNFINDGSEYSTTSDNEGKFTIRYANGNLVSVGGTDLDSQTLLDNLLITHKLTGHSEFKAVTPVTSIEAFMEVGANINNALGIDSAIDISITDPVANKGDGGIYDFLYEKGNQLTVLAYALQNITNDLNVTSETTEDYFKAIAEEIETEFNETSVKVDIETETFVNKAFENVIAAKSVTIDEIAKANTVKALSGFLPIVEVKASDDLTTSVIRFAVSTLQEDIKAVANGTASAEKVASYTSDVIDYIAQDQNISSNDITPDISAIDDSITTSEDTPVNIQVLANDSYITTAPVSITATNGDNGTVEVAESFPEQITYSPNADYNGSDTFSYTITQGDKISSADVSVNISSVNDAPSLDIASTIQVPEGEIVVTTVSVSDPDEDELTLTIGGTDAESFNLSDEYVLSFKEAPDYEVKSSYSIELSLTDGIEIINKNISINIIDIQEVFPVNDSVQEMEDSSIRIDVLKNDSFIGLNPIIEYDEPINGYIEIDNTAQSINEYGHQTLIFYPNTNWFGEESINYYLTAGGEQRTAKIDIKYLPVNDPPEIKIIKKINISVEPNSNGEGNVYVITNDQRKDLYFNAPITYKFTFPPNHPLKFSTTEDGVHNGGTAYIDNVESDPDGLTTITITESTPEILYYYCESHPGMGSSFIKSSTPFRLNENLDGEIVQIIATDVDSEDLNYELTKDDSIHFEQSSEGIISINIEPDYENPQDINNDNIYSILYSVSDGFISTNYDLNLIIDDVNYPAQLLKEFQNPSCKNDGYFGANTAIDGDGDTLIMTGRTSCGSNNRYTYAYNKLENNSWVRMPTYQYLNGSLGNQIRGDVNKLDINNTGNRFVISKWGLTTKIIPYDFTDEYENIFNWNETFELNGDDSAMVVSGSGDGRDGGSSINNGGTFMVAWRSSGTNIWGQPSRSDIKVFSLNSEPYANGDYGYGTIFDEEFNQSFLGQGSVVGAAISDDGKTLAVSFDPNPEFTQGGYIKVYEWNLNQFNDTGVRLTYCESDKAYNTFTIRMSSDGNRILINPHSYSNSFCVIERSNDGSWSQLGQTIVGSDLTTLNEWPYPYVIGFSSKGNRLAVSYRAGEGSAEAWYEEVRIYDWSIKDNKWKQSGINIAPINGEEIEANPYNSIKMSSDGSKLILPSSTRGLDPSGVSNEIGTVRLYHLPLN